MFPEEGEEGLTVNILSDIRNSNVIIDFELVDLPLQFSQK